MNMLIGGRVPILVCRSGWYLKRLVSEAEKLAARRKLCCCCCCCDCCGRGQSRDEESPSLKLMEFVLSEDGTVAAGLSLLVSLYWNFQIMALLK
jgi:hypothetical protein